MNQNPFTNLPSSIIITILSRLPVRTIITCKCVCKSWLGLIESPAFAVSESAPGLAVFSSDRWSDSNLYRIYELKDELDLERHELRYAPVTAFALPYHGWIEGAADGLLLLRDLELPGLFVCNPITRDYIELHYPPEFEYSYPQVVTFGFGASGVTRQHKVVRIFHDCVRDQRTHELQGIPKSECHVYTLGTGSWRTIAPGALLEYSCRSVGAFLNGNLHWLVHDLKGSALISCFNLETEVFSTLVPPPSLHGRGLVGLFALEDCLCLCDNSSDDEIVIWLMKEYGVGESWTKEFVISKIPDYAGESYEVVRPIKVFKDGDILMQWGDLFLCFYSSKTRTIRKVDTFATCEDVAAILHIPSFLPLERIERENVKKILSQA